MAKEQSNQGEFLRLTPLFPDGEGKLVEGTQTYVVARKAKELVVALVPARSTSVEHARAKEQELTNLFQTDVLVVSDNVKFMRMEPVDYREVAGLLKEQA